MFICSPRDLKQKKNPPIDHNLRDVLFYGSKISVLKRAKNMSKILWPCARFSVVNLFQRKLPTWLGAVLILWHKISLNTLA